MNFFISIIGWFIWNVAELAIKDKQLREDNDPNTSLKFREFADEKKYMWIGSLACIPLLLWMGSKQLGLQPLAPILGHEIGWNDLYTAAAGPFFEIIIFVIGQANRIIKKKE